MFCDTCCSFLEWRRGLNTLQEDEGLLLTPFERNLELWRQLWRVIERRYRVCCCDILKTRVTSACRHHWKSDKHSLLALSLSHTHTHTHSLVFSPGPTLFSLKCSDVVVQIVDARNPLLFRCADLDAYVSEVDSKKSTVLLLNKADLLTPAQRYV